MTFKQVANSAEHGRWPPARSVVALLTSAIVLLSTLTTCTTGPGAGVRWAGYPALIQTSRTYRWLVIKCRPSDVSAIPARLDTEIPQFFGIAGTGYGNIVDYFHDVSYNRVSVIADTFLGWTTAPFGQAALQTGGPMSLTRGQRVESCLSSVPADQLPDLSEYYGVVAVTNVIMDGGACDTGPIPITVRNKTFSLGCLWFDPNSLYTAFAAHEFGHGLGLKHSFDDEPPGMCGGEPESRNGPEYCDPWDIMSGTQTYMFSDKNWTASAYHLNGPGLSVPGLMEMGWIHSANQRRFDHEGGEQVFRIRALSHPRGSEPLMVWIDVGATTPTTSGIVTIEFRQSDGWDKSFLEPNVPASVRAEGGAVLVHQWNRGMTKYSVLLGGGNSVRGALTPCRKMIITGADGGTFHVIVNSFDLKDGSAEVSVGFGPGWRPRCATDVISPGGVEFRRP